MYPQNPRNSIRGWYFTPDEIAGALSNGHMLNPSIDLSNPCNLNCPYCYIEEKNSSRKIRRPNELTHTETETVIRDLHACGARTINLVGAGEPTIDPHFEETVKLIYSLGMTTVLFTNGIRFSHDTDLLRLAQTHNVSIVLKYNSAKSDIQDLVAGRRGYAEKRDKALHMLVDYGFNAHEPTRLGIDTIAFQGNIKELPEIHRWCRNENIFPIAGDYIPTGRTDGGKFQGFNSLSGFTETDQNRITSLLQPSTDAQRATLFEELRSIDQEFGIIREGCSAYYGGGICTQILGLYIDIEGNIWPCVARQQKSAYSTESKPLGNVRKGHSISSLWRGYPYLTTIRNSFNGGCPYKVILPAIQSFNV